MKIIEYDDKYSESVKDLLAELQTYIADIDREKYNIVGENFHEEYFKKTMDEVNKYEGKILLALNDDSLIGLIVGLVNNDDVCTYDFEAPKRGRITELVVSKSTRSKGVGTNLMNEMEKHFKSIGCKAILLDVFEYNENAMNFYFKKNYFTRTRELMKKI